MKKRQLLKNIISAVFTYGVIVVLNIIVSRYILLAYGSEVNGLFSSVNQIFTYIALLEAGIGLSTVNALYKPLADKNNNLVLEIISASKQYYRKSALWYLLCVILVAAILPIVLSSEINNSTIVLLVLFQGISGVFTFCFASAINNYLTACGKNYINSYTNIAVQLGICVAKIIICSMKWDIVYIAAAIAGVNVCKCIFYLSYMRKCYPQFKKKIKTDKSLLRQKNSFLVHEISGVIFSNTDMIILSVSLGLAAASVYAVYSMVFNALWSVIHQAFNSCSYMLGNVFARDVKKYEKVHDAFNAVYISVVFAIFTVAYFLIIPFIGLYTSGILDANYIDYKLPVLFVIIQLLSACRIVDNNTIKMALHAKQTISRTIIEMCINITMSIILVYYIGMYGVLLGTVIALLYRTNDIVLYVNKKILHRSPMKEYKIYILNICTFVFFAIIRNNIVIRPDSYLMLCIWGLVLSVVIIAGYLAVNYFVFRKEITYLIREFKS